MSTVEALAQIKSLRVQLEALEARIRKSTPSPPGLNYTVADLHGLLKDEADFSTTEIDTALYRITPFPQP